jgi:hypothetical protein
VTEPGDPIPSEPRAVVEAWAAAELAGDASALDRLLASDFVAVGPLGCVLTKAEWLERHASGDQRYDAFAWEEPQVRRNEVGVPVPGQAEGGICVTEASTDARRQPPGPDPALGRLGRLVGTWGVKGRESGRSGRSHGRVTFEWLHGGLFLVQRVDLDDIGRKIKGVEIIGRERDVRGQRAGQGGRLALHRHRRQHARLRVRDGRRHPHDPGW